MIKLLLQLYKVLIKGFLFEYSRTETLEVRTLSYRLNKLLNFIKSEKESHTKVFHESRQYYNDNPDPLSLNETTVNETNRALKRLDSSFTNISIIKDDYEETLYSESEADDSYYIRKYAQVINLESGKTLYSVIREEKYFFSERFVMYFCVIKTSRGVYKRLPLDKDIVDTLIKWWKNH